MWHEKNMLFPEQYRILLLKGTGEPLACVGNGECPVVNPFRLEAKVVG
jgi:hypothetical protein